MSWSVTSLKKKAMSSVKVVQLVNVSAQVLYAWSTQSMKWIKYKKVTSLCLIWLTQTGNPSWNVPLLSSLTVVVVPVTRQLSRVNWASLPSWVVVTPLTYWPMVKQSLYLVQKVILVISTKVNWTLKSKTTQLSQCQTWHLKLWWTSVTLTAHLDLPKSLMKGWV